MDRIYRQEIDKRIQECTDILTNSVRQINGEVGWHQHLGSHKVGIVATAMAILYYNQLGLECPQKDNALRFLRAKVNDDGGWPYISNSRGNSNVEATCWVLQALNSQNENEEYQSLIDNGIQWILSQHNRSDVTDTGWPFASGSTDRTYITAIVLRTLLCLGKTDVEAFASAKQWLLAIQNKDGGWGEKQGDPSSIFFTCYCICVLNGSKEPKVEIAINDAVLWLQNRLKSARLSDDSIICYIEFIEHGIGPERTRIQFFHYVLPYVVHALLLCGRRDVLVFNSLIELLHRSPYGIVKHPMLENSRIIPIWGIYDTVNALTSFRNNIKNWDKQYSFICIFNRIVGFEKYNPIRIISFFNIWWWNSLVVFILVLSTIKLWPMISSWSFISGEWTKAILASIAASILYNLPSKLCQLGRKLLKF